MSRSVNKAVLIGNLGADPEQKRFESGKLSVQFSIATQNWRPNSKPQWHRIVLWDKAAEIAGTHLHKGDQVYVEGEIRYRSYEDRNGQTRQITEIHANTFIMLGVKGRDAQYVGTEEEPEDRHTPSRGGRGAYNPPLDDDDDLPF